MTRSLLLGAASAACFAQPLQAQEAPDAADDALPEVVVTATRLHSIVSDTPGARAIDARTIRQRGAVFAADILSDVPGLSVTRTGAFGGAAQVRMRGAEPGKALILIDGVPVNDPAEVNGAFDFSVLDLVEVERIEVLSGPQSSLWGSDAIGGVIAFTTREPDGLRAEAEAGGFDTRRGRLAAGVATERYALGAYVSRLGTDGISAADEADGNTEADGFDTTTLGARGRLTLTSAASLDASMRWSGGQAETDGFPPPAYVLADNADTQTVETWSGFGRLRLRAGGLAHQFTAAGSTFARETVSDFPTQLDGSRRSWRWQADGSARGLAYAFGAERDEAEASLSTGLSEALSTTSAFATAQARTGERLTMTGALRWDDTDFGSRVTGRLAGAYALDGGLTVSGAYGTGFKAPSISQAVCDFCVSSSPFPALRAETAEGYEAALGWRSGDGRIETRATVYRLRTEDQITYVFDPASFESVYLNLAETRTEGLELEGRALLPRGFDLSLAWAFTDAIDVRTGARLLRIPERAASVTLGWSGDRLSTALTVRTESDQPDSGGVGQGFVTANLNGAWRLTDQVELTLRVENLADEHYQQVLGYGEPGRSAYAGVRLRY